MTTNDRRFLQALAGIAADADLIARGKLDPALAFDIARRARDLAAEASA